MGQAVACSCAHGWRGWLLAYTCISIDGNSVNTFGDMYSQPFAGEEDSLHIMLSAIATSMITVSGYYVLADDFVAGQCVGATYVAGYLEFYEQPRHEAGARLFYGVVLCTASLWFVPSASETIPVVRLYLP